MEQKWKDLEQAQGMDEAKVTAAAAMEVPGRHAVQEGIAEGVHQHQELPDQTRHVSQSLVM